MNSTRHTAQARPSSRSSRQPRRAFVAGAALSAFALALGGAGCKPKNLTFASLNPASGRLGGGEEVRIRGTAMRTLMNPQVRIGGHEATNVGVADDETLVLTTPEGREADLNRNIDVSILTADGKSIVLRGAWQYRPGAGQQSGPRGPNDDLRRRL